MKKIINYCAAILAFFAAAGCKQEVLPVAVQSVTLDEFMIELTEGETDSLTVSVYPYNADNQTVVWSSDDESVAVVSDGIVTAVHEGAAIISVTSEDGGKTAECAVTVKPIEVGSISLDKTVLELVEGAQAELLASILPQSASHQGVMWSSSDYSIASVDIYGMVKAVKVGTATITATSEYGSMTADCQVTVMPAPVDSVCLNKTSVELNIGGKVTLKATVFPDNAADKKVSWSTDAPEIAEVDTCGVVTALKAGQAVITVTTEDGGKSAVCTVVVRPQPVASVSLDKTSLKLYEGASAELAATVLPANATDKNVVWSSDDTDVAEVDSDGKVTAIKAGSAVITVTTKDGGKTATCAVTVMPILVASVSLDKSSLTLAEGDSAELTATVMPENASNKNVEWSSSAQSVASVDADGKVTAIKVGSAVITVTTKDGGKTARCVVTVVPAHPESVTIDKTSLELMESRSAVLTATILPETAVNKNVIWSSDNPEIASVDSDGKVSAHVCGTVTITVTTEDGELTAECTVKVVPLVVNGCEAVNLGLSVNWATCNLGASRPQDSGYYLSWGEIEQKTNYHINTYKYCEKSMTKMTKYCTKSNWGTVDNKTVLEPEDDAATQLMKGTWRIPTAEECKELVEKCKWSWNSSYKGYVITGPNGNCIFIPAAGYRVQTNLLNVGALGYIWNSSLNQTMCCGAGLMYYAPTMSAPTVSNGDRYMGLTIRAVTE